MSEEHHLINDLQVRSESTGGWTFVHLRDSDDGDTFMLGEDEILSLYEYLGKVILDKRLHPLTFEGAVNPKPENVTDDPRKIACKACSNISKNMNDEQIKKEFGEWLESRPQIVKDVANKLPPWNIYRMKETGQHCQMYSYSEDGTVTVSVIGHDKEFQSAVAQMMPLSVFGVSPDSLEILPNAGSQR